MRITIAAVVVLVIGGIIYSEMDLSPQTYEKIETTATTTRGGVVEPEQDVLEKSSQELERINTQLDEEEQRLLDERKAIEAETNTQLQTIDERLEAIRELRTSF